MEPLATEPLVVLASASPIVGALLGENRIILVSGHSHKPRLPIREPSGLGRLALILLRRSDSDTRVERAVRVAVESRPSQQRADGGMLRQDGSFSEKQERTLRSCSSSNAGVWRTSGRVSELL
jgi:hypothetical protein